MALCEYLLINVYHIMWRGRNSILQMEKGSHSPNDPKLHKEITLKPGIAFPGFWWPKLYLDLPSPSTPNSVSLLSKKIVKFGDSE